MSIFALLIVLGAAFCHAGWNFLFKRVNGGVAVIWLFSLLSSIIYLPLAAVVFLQQQAAFNATQLIFIAGSAVSHMAYFLLLQRGYRKGDLSLVYPTARACGPLLATLFAVTMLGEAISWQIGIGMLVIIVGVLMLTGGFLHRSVSQRASIIFGFAIGLLIGGYTTWDAYAVTALVIPPILLDYCNNIFCVCWLAPHACRHRQTVQAQWREHKRTIVWIALLNPLAYILVLYALTFTPVVYVAPTREISVLLTVLLGTWLLGEGYWKVRLAWSAVILLGVTLLATA